MMSERIGIDTTAIAGPAPIEAPPTITLDHAY